MFLRKWEDLPPGMQTQEIWQYYNVLKKHKFSLVVKRCFDVLVALILLVLFSIPMVVISIFILLDSPGGVFYRQIRVTTYGKEFRIHKFRTMVANADQIGTQVTVNNDLRITKIGALLRRYRLDELPQLLDVLEGNMSFVGTRPEVVKYVKAYTGEMRATLLLPAGITSEASIRYKDEDKLLDGAKDVDATYIESVLPEKMKYNLQAIRHFNFWNDIVTMFRTIFAVLGKNYNDNEWQERE